MVVSHRNLSAYEVFVAYYDLKHCPFDDKDNETIRRTIKSRATRVLLRTTQAH